MPTRLILTNSIRHTSTPTIIRFLRFHSSYVEFEMRKITSISLWVAAFAVWMSSIQRIFLVISKGWSNFKIMEVVFFYNVMLFWDFCELLTNTPTENFKITHRNFPGKKVEVMFKNSVFTVLYFGLNLSIFFRYVVWKVLISDRR